MTDKLHQLAENDTPSSVKVPPSLNGLILWVLGRWGGGAVIGGLCCLGLRTVYEDNKATNAALLTIIQDNTRVNAQTVAALESIKGEIHDAHARTGTPAKTPRE